ncbi:MAG TPA: alpha/beta hydrolase [Kofleriaceae bacterium]|nr:alpha/beta hydrolase [Kofleriaceae bacterium]
MSRCLALALTALAACSTPSPASAQPPAPAARPAAPATPFAVKVTGHGPPMIFLPGLGSSGDVWNATVAHVRDRFTCYVLTLPGFAGQPAVPGPFLAQMRTAIASYITAARLDHPIVVGHSLGGVLALELAIDHPELIRRLVIVDSLPFLTAAFVPDATAASAQAIAAPMRDAMRKNTGDHERQRAMIDTMVTRPADRATVLGWSLASDRATVADAMYDVMTTDLRADVARITAPTLVIGTWQGRPDGNRGEAAKIFDAQYAKLRGVKITLADTARHFVMLDDPAFWLAQLDAFTAAAQP